MKAEWRWLAMLNYQVEPGLLEAYVPRGTELDQWEGKTYASMVGFLFLKTRVCGMAAPFHSNFEEVNLRFYVRRKTEGGWRRGVVFIKELVPRWAIAWMARRFYNENYAALPMGHTLRVGSDGNPQRVSYEWKFGRRTNKITVVTEGEAYAIGAGSNEEFITEHYWGYTRQRDGGTMEYQVEHPRWRVWAAREATLDCDVEGLYGRSFVAALGGKPASAFLAEGSEVTVSRGKRLFKI